MKQELTRYIGNREKPETLYKHLLKTARDATLETPDCMTGKKVQIKIEVTECKE